MIPVEVPCSCPGKPHKQDTVSLSEVTDVRIGMAVMSAMKESPTSVPDMEGAIAAVLLHVGPREWTFVDDKGNPLPLTPENIDARLTWTNGGMEVAEKANELYAGDVFSPLVKRMPKASPPSPTESSTSPASTPGSATPSSVKPSLHTVTGGRPSAEKAS